MRQQGRGGAGRGKYVINGNVNGNGVNGVNGGGGNGGKRVRRPTIVHYLLEP